MKKLATLSISIVIFFGLVGINNASAQSQYPGQHVSKMKVDLKIPIKAFSFDLKDVKLLDSPFKENEKREEKWLRSLDSDRLLLGFRVNAGMNTYRAMPLGGWEALNVELRGHTMGHVLSGLALMYASTGDDFFKLKGDSLVSELAKVQNVLNQGGYLSAFPQNLINRVIAGKPVWAPWYTLHKILAGLLDQYLYADNLKALKVAEKMGDWAYQKLKNLSQDQLDIMLGTEFGGAPETFYNLYAITGEQKYLEVAGMFYHHKVLDPLAKDSDMLQNYHANTYIPKIIAEARGYELTGDIKKEEIAKYFWQTVIDHHTYATGGNSDHEYFFTPDSLPRHISARTTESCNTYNMLKLTDHLFSWTAEAKYADYYEQALYNHILGTQDPETGMVCYFMPFKPGLFKVYSTPNHSFWCCVGTGFENHAKYGEAIYFHGENGLYVNLFIPSELNWKEKGVTIRQETNFPESDKTKLTVEAANDEQFLIQVRYPSWAKSGASVIVNGKKQRLKAKPGSYIVLNRTWKTGDVIEISFPMDLHLVPTNDDPQLAAIAYGPIVLAGEIGREGISDPAPYAENQTAFENYETPQDLVDTIYTHGEAISKWLKPVTNETPLTFNLVDQPGSNTIKLIPYYRLDHQRYVIYWNLNSKP